MARSLRALLSGLRRGQEHAPGNSLLHGAMLLGVSPGQRVQRFDSALVAGLDEPIRRYLTHAVAPGAVLTERVWLTMHGHIKVGHWIEAFDAEQYLERPRVRMAGEGRVGAVQADACH